MKAKSRNRNVTGSRSAQQFAPTGVVRLASGRIAFVIVTGLVVAAALNALVFFYLRTIAPALVHPGSGSKDWMLPVILCAVFTLILFPRNVRRLPLSLIAAAALIAGGSSVLLTVRIASASSEGHPAIAVAFCMFVIAGTLKAVVAAALVEPPTGSDLAEGATGMLAGAAVEIAFAAIGGKGGSSSDGGFSGGGGSFGGGGASGSW